MAENAGLVTVYVTGSRGEKLFAPGGMAKNPRDLTHRQRVAGEVIQGN